jgi:hypothetical protein
MINYVMTASPTTSLGCIDISSTWAVFVHRKQNSVYKEKLYKKAKRISLTSMVLEN